MPGKQFPADIFGSFRLIDMPAVEITPHLYRFFPTLADRTIQVPSGSIAEVLFAVNEIAPGFSDYVMDEQGALRRHVSLSINDTLVVDRKSLTDQVPEDATVFIFQALSGG